MSADRGWLVPRPIRQGFELAEGWGVRQGLVLAGGLAAGGVLAGGVWLATASQALAVVPLLLVGGVAAVAARPMPPSGEPVMDLVSAWWRWARSQRRFVRDWGDGS